MALTQAQTNRPQMTLQGPAEQDVTSELRVLQRMLAFTGARVLELGCGGAEKTRLIAENEDVAAIVAAEVDQAALEKNLQITDLPQVEFKSYGAQQITEPDESFDIVLMFKSLHHVPEQDMDRALEEIHRVLKPGGLLYCSEPVFAGAFNEIMRLFHDEEIVRRQAFEALRRAVETDKYRLREEYFFYNIIRLESWDQYRRGILNVTHTDHQLSDDTLAEVQRRFEACASSDGFVFEIPNRVDLLEKPG
jgi:ubiquinone/menaquinone biosynthesis C-methylase UbiE